MKDEAPTQECPHCEAEQSVTRAVCLPKAKGGCGKRMHGDADIVHIDPEHCKAAVLGGVGDGDDQIRSAQAT